MTHPLITWTGDLDDDCTARWYGLILRAECMGCADEDCDGPETCVPEHGEWWWWDVTERVANEAVVLSGSNGDGILDNGQPAGKASGVEARAAAETVARIVVKLRERGLIKEGRLECTFPTSAQ